MFDVIIIGGGAAGIFAAIAAKTKDPQAKVAVLEKTAVLLSKVRISGGGRCNVTHSCFESKQLVSNYPRGFRELIGPFSRFQPRDTIDWFESRGVKLKTEEDGRIFPTSDKSESIIQCLLDEAKRLGVEILTRQRVSSIRPGFQLELKDGETIPCKRLVLATGNSEEGHQFAKSFGHTIQNPVPSLFTFNVPTSPLKELSGVSVEEAELKVGSFVQRGPLLITHFGFSGPAALKLSAFAARFLHENAYQVKLLINWLPLQKREETLQILLNLKKTYPQKILESPFKIPKSLWKSFAPHKRLHDVSLKELNLLVERLHSDVYQVEGKTTHKEEFVTCGGIALNEVNFKTMESKLCPGLFFAGEILDIDGVTGGFNFQNAWTTGYIAGHSI